MKTNYKKIGPYWLIALTVIISLLLAACGDTKNTGSSDFGNTASGSTGQGQVAGECDSKGEVTGQILVLTDPKQDLKSAPATLTLTASGSEPKTFTTDADGTYTIKDLDVNEYELEASVPGGVDGKTIDARKKYLTVDDCYIETVSMVLTAQGIEIPPAPAATTTQPQVVYVNNQPHYSVTHDPFFWLWLFDRPHSYGYGYPPVYTTRIYNTNNVIYVPQSRPAPPSPSYHYTTYADSSSSSTAETKVKAAPVPVSKGSTRLGSSGYSKPPVVRTPSSSGSSTSKGSTRNDGSSSVPKPGIKTPASSSSSNSSSSSAPHPSGNSSSSSSSSGSKSSGSSSSSSSGSSKSSRPSSGSSSKGSTRSKR